jgi:hypothetical protein
MRVLPTRASFLISQLLYRPLPAFDPEAGFFHGQQPAQLDFHGYLDASQRDRVATPEVIRTLIPYAASRRRKVWSCRCL